MTVLRRTHGPPVLSARVPRIARAWVAALPLLAACMDRRPVTLPVVDGPAPQALPVAECTVNVREQSLRCTDARRTAAGTTAGSGAEEVSVRLASSETSYDANTGTLTTRVALQNLLRQKMGTNDGATVAAVRVGFAKPTVTAGEGTATVIGDGLDTFTAAGQPYYSYSQILGPNQVSHPRTWTFSVSPGVTAFTFSVYVSAPLAETGLMALLVAEVWSGAVDTDWGTAGNWQNGVVPGTSSAVDVPDASQITNMPLLGTDAEITDLTVGLASTLGLGGNTLEATGNVDLAGQVTNGTLWMSGTGATLGGSVDKLNVDGRVTLQQPVMATGRVWVGGTGSLSVQNNGLFIHIP
ncbi:MAG TPA: hypothetical protein VFS20_19875 [Longimicrobium sp.]|nr:hypothetical protein [Longimicrobium sp.]